MIIILSYCEHHIVKSQYSTYAILFKRRGFNDIKHTAQKTHKIIACHHETEKTQFSNVSFAQWNVSLVVLVNPT